HGRRRHLDGRAAADRARRQLDPLGMDCTGVSWLRGRRRGPRLPHRRRRAPSPRGHGADEGPMIPKRWIEAYLRFLLRNRLAVSVVVAIMTVFFAAELRYIKVVPQFLDFYPGPSHVRVFGQDDANRVKFAVYSTKGIRGLYVSQDDTAVLVHAGFWEEELDFRYLYDRMMELKADVEDANHTVYITGFPWLYTTIQRYVPQVSQVFMLTVAALAFLLWNYFRTWTGIWVPMFSGLLSGIWALAFGPLLGL